ncbi:MAG TPA: protein kinase [Polyangiaceae bacterium]|nr:protein kinase [Polyangiaceae bacterium]
MALPEPQVSGARVVASEGHVVAERYELVGEIARGGMGTVWVARDAKLGRQVALKLMRAQSLEAFPDARERFEREAKAAAALKSSHVVQVHDYGVDDGTPYIAMELLEGESLKQRLEKVGRLGVREAADIMRQVAKGLRAAHRAGLVHRDLKPSNIFLAHRDEDEIVKLLDFGVVKIAMEREHDDTASGVLLGTPQYMSPEQARGLKDIDHRADLWSLAVIVYTMLTGKNPFESEVEAVGDIVIRVAVGEIPPPSEMHPALPNGIDAFFERALNRDREERFQSADEMARSFMTAGDVSYQSLDMETSTGEGWPVVAPPDRVSRSEAPTVIAVPQASSSESGMQQAIDPPHRVRKLALLSLVVVVGIAAILTTRAWLSDESRPAEAKLADTATPTAPQSASAAPDPAPSATADATSDPTPPQKTARPRVQPVPTPKASASQEDDKPPPPPNWFKDKRRP